MARGRFRLGPSGNPNLIQFQHRARVAREHEPVSSSRDDAADSELREYLREWRRLAAKERKVPAYVIMHDTSLDELCRRPPRTLDDIAATSGFGEKKTASYGPAILDAVTKFRQGARAMKAESWASSGRGARRLAAASARVPNRDSCEILEQLQEAFAMSDRVKIELANLYKEMGRSQLTPLWTDERAIVPPEPPPHAVPWLWKWAQLYDYGRRSAELVPLERGGDRRAMGLTNPGMHGQPYASPTLWAAVQWLNGHEVAPAHRHSSEAVRFIIEGHGAYTTVNGDRVYLERGDFVINPSWHWHDHGSDEDVPMIWMDALDIPLNTYLGAAFFEPVRKGFAGSHGGDWRSAQEIRRRPDAAGMGSAVQAVHAALHVQMGDHGARADQFGRSGREPV